MLVFEKSFSFVVSEGLRERVSLVVAEGLRERVSRSGRGGGFCGGGALLL